MNNSEGTIYVWTFLIYNVLASLSKLGVNFEISDQSKKILTLQS